MKITIVGGFFDNFLGKKSKVIDEISEYLSKLGNDVLMYNGGNLSKIKNLKVTSNILIWMPNIDNNEDKILPLIKEKNNKLILVSSKRIVEKGFYQDSDVIGRLLKTKSNLGIAVRKVNDNYLFSILDPLGNRYIETVDLKQMINTLHNRLLFLTSLTRVPSKKIGESDFLLEDDEFIKIVKKYGDIFSKHVNAVNPNRLLGNASTRCSYGFPAIRLNDYYFVSERNVDKSTLSNTNFVKVSKNENLIEYFGDKKPSVDTPIQVKIFNYFENINYIIHGHVYIKNAKFTEHKLPCGAVEEFDEIKKLLLKTDNFGAINLKGHGCLILGSKYSDFEGIELISRKCPEDDL